MRFLGAGGKINNNSFPHFTHSVGVSDASWDRYEYLSNEVMDESDYSTTTSTRTDGLSIPAVGKCFGNSTITPDGVIYSPTIGLRNGTYQHFKLDTNTDTLSWFDTGVTEAGLYNTHFVCDKNYVLWSDTTNNGNYMKYDLKTDTKTFHTMPSYLIGDWHTPRTNNEGIIYYLPRNSVGSGASHTIYKVDPDVGTISSFGSITRTHGYAAYALCPKNNCFYGAFNLNTNDFIKIDTNNDTVTLIDSGQSTPTGGARAYYGACAAPNGNIYMLPISNVWQVTVINPDNDSLTNIGTYSGSNGPRYLGGCLGADGRIYSTGWTFSNFFIIDTANNSRTQAGSLGGTNTLYMGQTAILAPNGKIYIFPFNATNVLVLSPSNELNISLNYIIRLRNSCSM
jgi:hypothetical protein